MSERSFIQVLLVVVVILILGVAALVGTFLLSTDTYHSPNFTWKGFREVEPGAPIEKVRRLVGEPLRKTTLLAEERLYENPPRKLVVGYHDGASQRYYDQIYSMAPSTGLRFEDLDSRKLRMILTDLGTPKSVREIVYEEMWWYTISPNSTHYWLAAVSVDPDAKIVRSKYSHFYFD